MYEIVLIAIGVLLVIVWFNEDKLAGQFDKIKTKYKNYRRDTSMLYDGERKE